MFHIWEHTPASSLGSNSGREPRKSGVEALRIIGLRVLKDFCDAHADCREWIENWISDVESQNWKTPQQIKDRYASASFLADRVVIFNVRGNNYRLEVQVAFNSGVVLIRWIGTHAEYSSRR
jgi:mRNA interferase HigB